MAQLGNPKDNSSLFVKKVARAGKRTLDIMFLFIPFHWSVAE
jgi:hypothetical protein